MPSMSLLRSRAMAVILAAIFSATAGPMLTFFVGALPNVPSFTRELILLAAVALYYGAPFGLLAGALFGFALSTQALLVRRGPALWISAAAAGALVGALVGPCIWAIDRATTQTRFFDYKVLSYSGAFGGTCCALAAAVIVRTLLWKRPASSSAAQ